MFMDTQGDRPPLARIRCAFVINSSAEHIELPRTFAHHSRSVAREFVNILSVIRKDYDL